MIGPATWRSLDGSWAPPRNTTNQTVGALLEISVGGILINLSRAAVTEATDHLSDNSLSRRCLSTEVSSVVDGGDTGANSRRGH
jgi:hypothetical protein